MPKVIAILQIKSKSYSDLYMWLTWYLYFIKCDAIYIVDESLYDITRLIYLFETDKIIHIPRKTLPIQKNNGLNVQQNTINSILRLANLKKDDIILIPDDDEFWWYDTKMYNSFIDCVKEYRQNLSTDSILVPWTLMRSKEVLQSRPLNQNFANAFQYRSNVRSCEHKPVLFFNGPINTTAHCGYKNCKSITKQVNMYFSKCSYDLPLRCYHFRFTTIDEFAKKQCEDISNHKPRFYMKGIFTKQIFNGENQNGNYDIKDTTVIDTLNSL